MSNKNYVIGIQTTQDFGDYLKRNGITFDELTKEISNLVQTRVDPSVTFSDRRAIGRVKKDLKAQDLVSNYQTSTLLTKVKNIIEKTYGTDYLRVTKYRITKADRKDLDDYSKKLWREGLHSDYSKRPSLSEGKMSELHIELQEITTRRNWGVGVIASSEFWNSVPVKTTIDEFRHMLQDILHSYGFTDLTPPDRRRGYYINGVDLESGPLTYREAIYLMDAILAEEISEVGEVFIFETGDGR